MKTYQIFTTDGTQAVTDIKFNRVIFGPPWSALNFASWKEASDFACARRLEHMHPWLVVEVPGKPTNPATGQPLGTLSVHVLKFTDDAGAAAIRVQVGHSPDEMFPVCIGFDVGNEKIERLLRVLADCPNARFVETDMTNLGREGSGR